jgi:integrase
MRIWPQLPWPPCSEVRGFQVFDPQKVRRPKIPKHEVEYLTKEEVQRFFNAIPTHTQVISTPGMCDGQKRTLTVGALPVFVATVTKH